MTATVPAVSETLAADLARASFTLAQRFSAGATLWCVAPAFPQHAEHIAVEFVHPVIVGKRALPAAALTGPDLVGQVRVSARAGDVLVAVADAADAEVGSIMRRARAWGVTTLWLGHGPRPEPGAADHVLWLEDTDPLLPATGQFVLLYHLLWELTHVCFEHPGLLAAHADECTADVCITCSDEGRPAEVIGTGADGTATVRTPDGTETILTTLTGPLRPGDLVLVHAGLAIATVEA